MTEMIIANIIRLEKVLLSSVVTERPDDSRLFRHNELHPAIKKNSEQRNARYCKSPTKISAYRAYDSSNIRQLFFLDPLYNQDQTSRIRNFFPTIAKRKQKSP